MSRSRYVLIATLGESSQVGTRTFDELYFKRKIPISQVVWVHLGAAGPLLNQSIRRVRAEVESHYAHHCPEVNFSHLDIENRLGEHPLEVTTSADFEAMLFTLYREISRWKAQGYTVHLSISSGRKVLSALGVAAAQLTFDSPEDHCWHLTLDADESPESKTQMHGDLEGENALVGVPVLRWASWKSLAPRSLAEAIAQDPFHAQEIASQLSDDELLIWRTEFVRDGLNDEDRRVLELLSLYGWENAQIDKHIPGNCKNVVTRVWRKYCRYANTHRLPGDYDEGRLQRGRLIAEFHLVFQKIARTPT